GRGVVKRTSPLFESESETVMAVPDAGSYHRAVAGPPSRPMSTVMVRAVGTYAIASRPSDVRAAVTYSGEPKSPRPSVTRAWSWSGTRSYQGRGWTSAAK